MIKQKTIIWVSDSHCAKLAYLKIVGIISHQVLGIQWGSEIQQFRTK